MAYAPNPHWQMIDRSGGRKYLNAAERRRFLEAADRMPPCRRALCYLLAFTGCRISEALALTPAQLDAEGRTITLRTLKRRRLVYRTLPLPECVIRLLRAMLRGPADRFWNIHRVTAWRWVKAAMRQVQVAGAMASCKGLRHGFGMRAAACNIPPNLIQRWLGHASPATTAVYLDAVGTEERRFASRMW